MEGFGHKNDHLCYNTILKGKFRLHINTVQFFLLHFSVFGMLPCLSSQLCLLHPTHIYGLCVYMQSMYFEDYLLSTYVSPATFISFWHEVTIDSSLITLCVLSKVIWAPMV